MAVFRSTFGLMDSQQNRNRPDRGEHVFSGRGANGLDELTTSGTTGIVQDGGGDFEAPFNGYLTMVCTGACWVHIAEIPVAVVAKGFFMKLDERLKLELVEGDKIAVIDDS